MNDAQARFALPVAVAYSTDPETVRQILLDVAHLLAAVLSTGIGDNALKFELRVWDSKQVDRPNVLRSDLLLGIVRGFRKNGIEIPPAV